MIILLSVAFSIPATLIAKQLLHPDMHIVTLDTSQLSHELTLKLAKEQLSDTALDQRIMAWRRNLNHIVTQWAEQHDGTVIDKQVIYNRNTVDITNEISALMNAQRPIPL